MLKPGGTLVIACWCQRDNSTAPFTPSEQRRVDFMCTEWSHPYFISIKVPTDQPNDSLLSYILYRATHPNPPPHPHPPIRTLSGWRRARA